MRNLCVLVVEDELLVGMDIVSVLERAGFGELHHAATEAEALEQLQTRTWSLVVADANLNGRSIERVAALLRATKIPFLVLTGYDRHSLPAIIGDAPVLTKPFSTAELVATARRLCTGL